MLSGNASETVPVPQGYSAIDLATGKPVSQIRLDAYGKAGVEIKTGNAWLERHQSTIYQNCINGDACAVGNNAINSGLDGIPPTNIYILRPVGAKP